MMLNSNRKLKITTCLLLNLIVANSAYASILGWRLGIKDNDINSQYHARLPQRFFDDITEDQNIQSIKLTDAQKHQALVWGLSKKQEQRYVLLMQNRSGVYFKNTQLTPIEILGINARDDAERSQYAMLDAKQEFEKNAKILAFNAAYHKAATVLKEKLNLPIVYKFNYAKYSPYNYKPVQLQKNDKIMLFVKKDENVKSVVAYLMVEIERNSSLQMNIYFIDSDITKDEITKWAQRQDIPPEMVKNKFITLNFNHGQYAAVNIKTKKTPLLILARNGHSRIIDTGRF